MYEERDIRLEQERKDTRTEKFLKISHCFLHFSDIQKHANYYNFGVHEVYSYLVTELKV